MTRKPVDPDESLITWGWIGVFFFMPLALFMSIRLMTRKRFGHAIPMFIIASVASLLILAYVVTAATPLESPAATTTTERTLAGGHDVESDSWLTETLGNDMEDQYWDSVTIQHVACFTTDHGTSKCNVQYDNEGEQWLARVVVTPGTADYPSTYNIVDDEKRETQ